MKSPEEIEQALSRLMPAALRPAAYEAICAEIEEHALEPSMSPPPHALRPPIAADVARALVESSETDPAIIDFPAAIFQFQRTPSIKQTDHFKQTAPFTQPTSHDEDPTVQVKQELVPPWRRIAVASVAAAGIAFFSGFLLLQRSSPQALTVTFDNHATETAKRLAASVQDSANSTGQEANELVDQQQISNVLIDRREQLVSDDASQLVIDEDGTVHRAYRFRRTTEEKVRDSATGLIITVTEPRDEEVRIPVNSF